VIGQGASGTSGAYVISGLQPGNYSFTLDPGTSRFQGQTLASYVGTDGICLNCGFDDLAGSSRRAAKQRLRPGRRGRMGHSRYGRVAAGVLGAGAIAAAVIIPGSEEQGIHKTSVKH
jgi:hypothetical protein